MTPEDAREAERPSHTPLFGETDRGELRTRWEEVQSTFVDEPRDSVKLADGLVAEVMQRLAKSFADERHQLESQWSEGEDVSTEDLRLAFQKYRSFFDRLLSV